MHRREFLLTALAAGASGPALAAVTVATTAEARRVSDQALALSWSDKTRPAAIYASTNPDAPRGAMTLVRKGVTGGAAEVAGPVSPRPYYLLAGPGGETRVAERLLPLKGGRNFRDMGGYRAADGRQVRWGRIYRSGVMLGLTPQDMDYLHGLGIRQICDLRNPDERRAAPSPFMTVKGVEVLSTDYKMPGTVGAFARAKDREEAVDAFASAYVDFIDVLEPQYREIFARLVRGEAPLAVNCTAGKDRTGVASALILSVLGVPRETVVADYALTQVYSPPALSAAQMSDPAQSARLGLPPEQAKAFAAMPADVLQVMMGSDPEVMRRALKRIDAKYGGPVGLAKARFGLTDAAIAQLRGRYLI